MAGLEENVQDLEEVSTEDQINNDAEITSAESNPPTADDSQEQEIDQQNNEIELKEPENIIEEIPLPIDESLIGHITTSKCCVDFNSKLFNSRLTQYGTVMRDTVAMKRGTMAGRRKSTFGSKRQSYRKSRAGHVPSNRTSKDLLGTLNEKVQSFIDDTMDKVEKIDKQLTQLEKPSETN